MAKTPLPAYTLDRATTLQSTVDSTTEPRTFSTRLTQLIRPRKRTPWSTGLLIPSGTMNRMFAGDGIPPTYETLQKIARTENVNLSWLLGERVPRFNIAFCGRDEDLATELQVRLEDEPGWSISILSSPRQSIFALHQPAQIEEKRGQIDYTALELLTGQAGDATTQLMAQAQARVHGIAVLEDVHMVTALRNGVGTFQLFGDDQHAGLVRRPPRIHGGPYPRRGAERPPMPFQIAEARGPAPYVAEPLNPFLARLLALWKHLPEHDQAAIELVLEPLLDRAEKHR